MAAFYYYTFSCHGSYWFFFFVENTFNQRTGHFFIAKIDIQTTSNQIANGFSPFIEIWKSFLSLFGQLFSARRVHVRGVIKEKSIEINQIGWILSNKFRARKKVLLSIIFHFERSSSLLLSHFQLKNQIATELKPIDVNVNGATHESMWRSHNLSIQRNRKQ